MGALRSPALLRTLLCETTAEFRAINSTELPDGATIFNREDETLWRLNKFVGDSFDTLGPAIVQKPDDGTDARWFAEATGGSSPYGFSAYLAAPVAVTMTNNQWNALGSTSGTFAKSTGDATLYTMSLTSGLITYHGPDRLALVTMQASVNNGIGATDVAVHSAISLDGDVAAGGTTAYPEKGELVQGVIDTASIVTVQRIVRLSADGTLQMMFRNSTNGDDLVANNYQVTIAPF